MKNLPLNEKHLADKLQNVPVPEVEPQWEQMRKLLDREMPEPAAAWSGNSKWWWVGITAAIVMIAAWLANPFRQAEHGVASKNDIVAENKVSEPAAKSHGHVAVKKGNEPAPGKAAFTTQASSSVQTSAQAPVQASHKETFTKEKSSPQTTTKSTPAKRLLRTQPKSNLNLTPEYITEVTETEPSFINTTLDQAENPLNPAGAFNELQHNQPTHIAISGKTDKAFARELRKKTMKDDNRRLSRASMRGNSRENDRDITFAAGLALPQSFAISGQQSPNYNIAAKTSRFTDYLPAPFFQYHVNDKMFVQTEFHFQSPQYTQRLLLSQMVESSANSRREKNQYLEKLYYFNIPFNVYYSPARNFYIGGGLQYSSLLGGVATYEDKRSEGTNVISYTAVTSRFKDDSAAAVFRPSEWRYQFDANYYFNRFSLGIRYNQAMKDFINTQVGPNAVIGRNKSFLLYLRFNIWEERKKTND